MRLKGKSAIVVGGGQVAGQGLGNGRATALLFAREGAQVLVVDRDGASAADTKRMIDDEGGQCHVMSADIADESDCAEIVETCVKTFGSLDILHNNVGIAGGDASIYSIEADAWDRIHDVNIRGTMLVCKHAMRQMREQRRGAIVNVSSAASLMSYQNVAYKTSKAAINALTHHLATAGAKFGVRANCILPGLINTPMAIEEPSRVFDLDRAELIASRNAMVPLRGQMGDAWDVANAALFLASDDAKFITGVVLPVDGGQLTKVGV